MSLSITFELSDTDIEHFLAMAREAQEAISASGMSPDKVTAGVRELFAQAHDKDLPEFISTRLDKLETLVNMVDDDEWQLPKEDLDRVVSAIAYFANPDDLIPDRVPGIGFLDDAIMAELVVESLNGELTTYEEFCAYRSAEEKRRKNQGLDPNVGREDWLADKRSVLHNRMRKLRAERSSSPISRIKLF
ncbi:MAG: YkvA family protein [Gammaproteobacteria bacterium]